MNIKEYVESFNLTNHYTYNIELGCLQSCLMPSLYIDLVGKYDDNRLFLLICDDETSSTFMFEWKYSTKDYHDIITGHGLSLDCDDATYFFKANFTEKEMEILEEKILKLFMLFIESRKSYMSKRYGLK